MVFIKKNPAIPRAGNVAMMTSVISHPETKANVKPAISEPIVMINVETF
jgi:hypothetical protein